MSQNTTIDPKATTGMAQGARPRLGDLLSNISGIKESDIQPVAALARQKGIPLGRALVDARKITRAELARALAKQANMEYMDLAKATPAAQWTTLIGESIARQHGAVAVGRREGLLVIAMRDAKDIYAIQAIERALGQHIRVFADEDAINATLNRAFSKTEAIGTLANAVAKEVAAAPMAVEAQGSDDASPVARLVQNILDEALGRRATDVHIEPMEDHLKIRYRIDGDLVPLPKRDRAVAAAVVQRLKLMSDLDISERRKPQDGAFTFRSGGGKPINARVAVAPSRFGETAVVRLIAAQGEVLPLDQLRFSAHDFDLYLEAIGQPNGVILLTGPTGSGKTTTLYSTLGALNTGSSKIITVEDPIEATIDGIVQTEVNEKAGYGFPEALRSILRQDPDVVLIGEMRDKTTAITGLQAAQTGHLVLSTLHTNDAKSAPTRLIAMGAEPFMVASSLRMVVAQRLIKLNCPHCKVAHPFTPAQAAWIKHSVRGIIPEGKPMKGMGCEHCLGTGWHGRRAVHECLSMDAELIGYLERNDTQSFLRASEKKLEGKSLAARAGWLALTGQTTVAEAQRATGGSE
jgi:MSHA biogenesis protein MshE